MIFFAGDPQPQILPKRNLSVRCQMLLALYRQSLEVTCFSVPFFWKTLDVTCFSLYIK